MFNAPKTASGFTLPTSSTTAATTGFQFGTGSGDAKNAAQAKPALGLFGAPPSSQPTSASTGFTLGGNLAFSAPAPTSSAAPAFVTPFNTSTTTTTTATGLLLGTPASTTSTGLAFGTPGATASTGLSFGTPAANNTTTATPASSALGLSLGTATAKTTASTGLTFGTPGSSANTGFGLASSSASAGFNLSAKPVAVATPQTTATGITPLATATSSATSIPASTESAIPSGTLTFTQLEDAINKWTIDLEEQGKMFGNQAKQLNAWDRLLITNGEKILQLNNGIERVKQQQQQLDQELDFVLAQQKELEDLIVPLEKELENVNITDLDRNSTYQMAENMDSQLKQMSEDLKEIIEQLNEENKSQEMSNPITQIGKILNAHMNSLQWIDQNTNKISTQLDHVMKMNDINRKTHEFRLQ